MPLLPPDLAAYVGTFGELLAENQVVGFTTYGEQFNGMHVNQTFTGVALGYPRAA